MVVVVVWLRWSCTGSDGGDGYGVGGGGGGGGGGGRVEVVVVVAVVIGLRWSCTTSDGSDGYDGGGGGEEKDNDDSDDDDDDEEGTVGGQPLFLYLAYQAPHEPLQVPESYWRQYPDIEDSNRTVFGGELVALWLLAYGVCVFVCCWIAGNDGKTNQRVDWP